MKPTLTLSIARKASIIGLIIAGTFGVQVCLGAQAFSCAPEDMSKPCSASQGPAGTQIYVFEQASDPNCCCLKETAGDSYLQQQFFISSDSMESTCVSR